MKKKELQRFLTVLMNEFTDKVFQVEKVVGDDRIFREIKYKVEILDVNGETAEIRFINC